ncbi:hypothetical protein ATG_15650 [Desulfurococcaceae archaeon AG1]|nr:hypothetical protein ATG_15650 [Desulfurococcaceae archaeon AG1]
MGIHAITLYRKGTARSLINSLWDLAIARFFVSLERRLGENFVGLIDLLGGEVYESNVLVVVRSKDLETVQEVVRVKMDVEREFGDRVLINPYIAGEDERDVIRAFQEAGEDEEDPGLLRRALEMFRERALRLRQVVDVIIPGGEVYESNVLVVVRSKDLETVQEVVRVKMDVEREFGDRVLINPYIAGEDERDVIRAFQEAS